jgi:fumarylacetoacetase
MQTGDLIGTGTLSGPEPDQLGCLLEITKNGKEPVILDNGQTRTFMENGDTLTIRAQCKNGDVVISFGEVSGTLIS